MTSIRRSIIRRFLLNILEECGGLLMPESSLLVHLNIICKPVSTLTEMKDILNGMEADQQVIQLPTTEGIKIKITDQGRAARLES